MENIHITSEAIFDYQEIVAVDKKLDAVETFKQISNLSTVMSYYNSVSFIQVYKTFDDILNTDIALFIYKNKIIGICELNDYLSIHNQKHIYAWLAIKIPLRKRTRVLLKNNNCEIK